MKPHSLSILLSLLPLCTAQIYNVANSITQISGTVNTSIPNRLGNHYKFWTISPDNTTWDLTRSSIMPTTTPLTIPMLGFRQKAIIEPNRTAFIIVDMQNFFLHPALQPNATRGRLAVQPTINLVDAFRNKGMKILWVNWGIDNYDLITMPPAFLSNFSSDSVSQSTSFCSEMGMLEGTDIDMGGKLCRGSWNARVWGDLWPVFEKGIEDGTDLLFHKNRFSGLWGAQTPLGLYLQESGITTLFIGGVNSDQCVWSTLMDAFFKGFDIIYVEDCTGTTSPWFAEEMARYNADANGFLANSTYIIDALK